MQYHAIIPCTTRIYSLLTRSLVHRKQLAEFLLMPMQNAKIQPSQGHGAIGFTPWYRNDTGMIHEFARFVRSAQGKHADYCSFILEDSWSCVRWMPWCCKEPSYKLTKLGFITACGLVRTAMNNTEKYWKDENVEVSHSVLNNTAMWILSEYRPLESSDSSWNIVWLYGPIQILT